MDFNRNFASRAVQLGMIEQLVFDGWYVESGQHFEKLGRNVPLWLNPPSVKELNAADVGRGVFHPDFRIDVVVGTGDQVTIVEVKETGNVTAIGQLITYEQLYWRNYTGYSSLSVLLVAARIPPAIEYVCRRLKIQLWEAGRDVMEAISECRRQKRPG